MAAGLVFAACTTGPSQSLSPPPRPSTVTHATHPVQTKLQLHTRLRFACHNCSNPEAVTILSSRRNLQPGQQGAVLTVRGVGNLMGSCSRGHPAVRFRLTGRVLAGPPVVTEVRAPLARPIGFLLLTGFLPPAPPPVGGEQQFAFFQVVGGGEAADFSLALWATLTPATGGCAFAANGVLRIRGSDFLQRLG
jgi:hypothetical protein